MGKQWRFKKKLILLNHGLDGIPVSRVVVDVVSVVSGGVEDVDGLLSLLALLLVPENQVDPQRQVLTDMIRL